MQDPEKFELRDWERKTFVANEVKFDLINVQLKHNKTKLRLLESKANTILYELKKQREKVIKLESEKRNLEKYFIEKSKKTLVIRNPFASAIKEILLLPEEEQLKIVMQNERLFNYICNTDISEIGKGEIINEVEEETFGELITID